MARATVPRREGLVVIHVDGLHVPAGGTLPQAPIALPTGIRSRDLADSGSDVA